MHRCRTQHSYSPIVRVGLTSICDDVKRPRRNMVSCKRRSNKPPRDCLTITQAKQTVLMVDAELVHGADSKHVPLPSHKGNQIRCAHIECKSVKTSQLPFRLHRRSQSSMVCPRAL